MISVLVGWMLYIYPYSSAPPVISGPYTKESCERMQKIVMTEPISGYNRARVAICVEVTK